MNYILTAFKQRDSIRQYAFRGTTEDKQHRDFTVDVDLALLLRHRIPLQEIPLLCRRLLEGKPVSEQSRHLTFTPALMLEYAGRRDAAAREAALRRRGTGC
jgi:hypothetical protein